MMMRWCACACALAGCGRIGFGALGSRDGGDGAADALSLVWPTPIEIPQADIGSDVEDCTGAQSKLEMFFGSSPGPAFDLYSMTRASESDPWSAPVAVSVDNASGDATPRLAPGDLTLYFGSARAGGPGTSNIWSATRPALDQPFGAATLVTGVNTAVSNKWLSPCAGGRYLIVHDSDSIYEGTLGGAEAEVTAFAIGTVVTSADLSGDCLTAYFAAGTVTSSDIYASHRAAVSDPWPAPVLVTDLSDPIADDEDPWISDDGHMALFASNRALDGNMHIYLSTR